MANKNLGPAEDRVHKRFMLSGRAVLETAGQVISGEVVSISADGMLVKSATHLPYDTEIAIDFSVSVGGGQFLMEGQGAVVRICQCEVEIKFLQSSPGIIRLLRWLEKEHYPWYNIP